MINKEELIKYLEEQMKIYWEEPFGGIQLAFDELLESIDANQADVKILSDDAAQKTHEHLVIGEIILAGVDEAHFVAQIKHIAVVIVDENDVMLAVLCGEVGHVDDTLGLTRTFFTGNHLNHW